ncbi:MAG: restriction endonuclease subunit M [Abditibacteriota bacterium]|nr:restriction endonuclease subunit M [Abditibacteriota bacterium]
MDDDRTLLSKLDGTLDILLKDRTTRRNIIWATDDYAHLGDGYEPEAQIQRRHAWEIKPRSQKEKNTQAGRTRSRAEVFTPLWICNAQINLVDDAVFGRKGVFNTTDESGRTIYPVSPLETIDFSPITWQKYVDFRRLEITCGEAPYITSRYDAATGEYVDICDRVGILDRKFRAVCENVRDNDEKIKWLLRAIESCYGYEFQGDSLLLARLNVMFSYMEVFKQEFGAYPNREHRTAAAWRVSWNFWQMNGRTYTVPMHALDKEAIQYDFDKNPYTPSEDPEEPPRRLAECRIYDHRARRSARFTDFSKIDDTFSRETER